MQSRLDRAINYRRNTQVSGAGSAKLTMSDYNDEKESGRWPYQLRFSCRALHGGFCKGGASDEKFFVVVVGGENMRIVPLYACNRSASLHQSQMSGVVRRIWCRRCSSGAILGSLSPGVIHQTQQGQILLLIVEL